MRAAALGAVLLLVALPAAAQSEDYEKCERVQETKLALEAAASEILRCVQRRGDTEDCYRQVREVRSAGDDHASALGELEEDCT